MTKRDGTNLRSKHTLERHAERLWKGYVARTRFTRLSHGRRNGVDATNDD
jgi:hypothetical protein